MEPVAVIVVALCVAVIKSEECGMERNVVRPLRDTVHSESAMPWHAMIFRRKEGNEMQHLCAGTLISRHIVLTAAHCLQDYSSNDGGLARPETIMVAVGKRVANWTTDEPSAVKSEVREIRAPSSYYGQSTLYAHDMALIDLKAAVPLNDNVMPACVDWTRTFELAPGELGTTACWDDTVNRTIRKVQFPCEEYKRCIAAIPLVFRYHLTLDKFCSILKDGSPDFLRLFSGAGLTIVRGGRHYVQGILSTILGRQSSTPILTYTKVQYLELFSWLQDTKRLFDKAHEEAQQPQ